MNDYTSDFKLSPDKVWLNAASEGPLPNIAVESLKEAISWKVEPHLLNNDKFVRIPLELKKAIGSLINVSYQDVILGNSATFGIHLLAHGIQWEAGDEILLMQNDFPANIMPWLALSKKGVVIRQIAPKDKFITFNELKENITPKTRLVCLSHVHSFTGFKLDAKTCANICKENNIIFVLNLAQSLGNMPIDVNDLKPGAIMAPGYKWLLGPYGTGLCWINPKLRQEMDYNHANWIPMLSQEELDSEGPLEYKEISTARRYDQFGTANFFNYVPWTSSINYLLEIGLKNIEEHNQDLIDCFLQDLDQKVYDVISPLKRLERSNLVVISSKERGRNKDLFAQLKEQQIYPAMWKGNIRFTPHIYNTKEDIEQALKGLHKLAG